MSGENRLVSSFGEFMDFRLIFSRVRDVFLTLLLVY